MKKARNALFISLMIVVVSISGCSSKKKMAPEPLSKDSQIEYDIAYDFYSTNDMIRALGAASRAVELSPLNPDAHNLLGLIYFRRNEIRQAESEFLKAIEIDPKITEAYTNLGSLYYSEGRLVEAEATLKRAFDNPLYLYPDRVHNNLGLVQEAQGRNEDAVKSFEQAIALRPEYYLPYQNLGKLMTKLGQPTRAQVLFAEASRLCSECAEPQFYLGEALLKANQTTEAMTAFKRGAELDPRGYYGLLCKEALEKRK